MNNASGGAFWQTPLDELERQLGASSNGLNSTEAATRLLFVATGDAQPFQLAHD